MYQRESLHRQENNEYYTISFQPKYRKSLDFKAFTDFRLCIGGKAEVFFYALKQPDKRRIKENLQSHIIPLYRFSQIAILYFSCENNLRLLGYVILSIVPILNYPLDFSDFLSDI